MLNDEDGFADVPRCPADDTRMVDTLVGWRCPICGTGLLHRVA